MPDLRPLVLIGRLRQSLPSGLGGRLRWASAKNCLGSAAVSRLSAANDSRPAAMRSHATAARSLGNRLSRQLRRLRVLGLLKPAANTYRYYFTRAGRLAIAALERLTAFAIVPALASISSTVAKSFMPNGKAPWPAAVPDRRRVFATWRFIRVPTAPATAAARAPRASAPSSDAARPVSPSRHARSPRRPRRRCRRC